MSKKQIIIDGVDVKDCKRRIGKDNYCRYYKRPCSENNFNCIWKKYLRKEQECETLVCQLDFEVQKKECLEQECEELNKQVNDLLNKPEIQDKILWKIDNEALLGSKDAWIYKLEQTLTEIKEIVEKEVKRAPDGETFARPEIKQILQKIDEVENDNA